MRTTTSAPLVRAAGGVLAALTAIGLSLVAVTGAESRSAPGRPASTLSRVRAATGAYHNDTLAVAAGFRADDVCVTSPDGGMGYHYVNARRIQDDVVSRDKPEMLLYAPGAGDERHLVGVEYFKADDDQDLSTDDDRPSLFGRPFEGPMAGHAPGMPVHYDLHVWAWRSNPNGMFAEFNPRVSCAE